MSTAFEDGFLGNHFEQATLELAIAQNVLADAAEFVKTQASAPPLGVGVERAADDPHVILRFGQLRARLHAAEGLLARALRLAGANGVADADTAARECRAAAAGDASANSATTLIALLEARAFASDLVAEISSQLVAWGGPLRTGQHRRDANGQLPPAANHWNYHYAGNYYLRGIVPPTPEPQT